MRDNPAANSSQPTTPRGLERPVKMLCAGAPPPAAVLEAMERLGFELPHVYGLTESYGPAVGCPWQEEWAGLPPADVARNKARQGVRHPMLEDLRVVQIGEGTTSACEAHAPSGDAGGMPSHWKCVPSDGKSLGEVVMRGNAVMKGYLYDEAASNAALGSGWFRTGDLAVMHPSGYLEIKDRAKVCACHTRVLPHLVGPQVLMCPLARPRAPPSLRCPTGPPWTARLRRILLFRAERIFQQLRWRRRFTTIPQSSRPPWSRCRTAIGARPLAPSSPSKTGTCGPMARARA